MELERLVGVIALCAAAGCTATHGPSESGPDKGSAELGTPQADGRRVFGGSSGTDQIPNDHGRPGFLPECVLPAQLGAARAAIEGALDAELGVAYRADIASPTRARVSLVSWRDAHSKVVGCDALEAVLRLRSSDGWLDFDVSGGFDVTGDFVAVLPLSSEDGHAPFERVWETAALPEFQRAQIRIGRAGGRIQLDDGPDGSFMHLANLSGVALPVLQGPPAELVSEVAPPDPEAQDPGTRAGAAACDVTEADVPELLESQELWPAIFGRWSVCGEALRAGAVTIELDRDGRHRHLDVNGSTVMDGFYHVRTDHSVFPDQVKLILIDADKPFDATQDIENYGLHLRAARLAQRPLKLHFATVVDVAESTISGPRTLSAQAP